MKATLHTLQRRGHILMKRFVSNQIWNNFLRSFPFWIASLLTGLLAVGYALLFSVAEKGTQYVFHNYPLALFALTPLCFLLAWWIVRQWAPGARGSGIPQVMAAIELATPAHSGRIGKLLSLRIIVVKIMSSITMVLGGAAIGREGPTIQIAGSVFYVINRWLPARWPKLSDQSYILTGAAAGLAAAFNTPLGGVVFAMEELARIHIRYFRTALFSAVIIAGLTAQGILGPYLYIGYPKVSGAHFTLFFMVALTAVLAGAGGAVMSRLILALLRWRNALASGWKNVLYLLASGLVVAAIAYFLNPEILGSGKELMTRVLFTTQKHEEWHGAVLRILGPVLAFGTGAAGGVFAPSLAAGASLGAYAASLLEVSGANANILILGGMVGFLTGVTRTPFTSAILVLEMTDRHSIIFHLLLAALVAQVAALLIDRHSFYDHLKKQILQAEKPATTPAVRQGE
ncbi:MAG TPA: chloride channel protein [Chitinophagaceae bacterium]